MKSFILLLMVTLVHGGRRMCGDNCRIMPGDQLASPSTLYCKCFEKDAELLKAHQQKRAYEPAENMIFQNQLIGYPLKYTPYLNIKEPANAIPNWTNQQFLQPNIFNASPKTKRKNSNLVSRDAHFRSSGTPIYLDINIHESNDNIQTLSDLYQNKMREVIEKHLKDCLDLHVIIYSRNRGKGTEVNNILSERNKIYNKLPDSDLLIEINEKCNQSATIVKQSIDEIKTNQPYIDRFSTNINVNEQSLDQAKPTHDVLQVNTKYQDSDRHQLKTVKHHNSETETVEESITPHLFLSNISRTLNNNNNNNDNELNMENSTVLLNSMFRESFFEESTTNAPLSAMSTDKTVTSNFNVNVLNMTSEYEQESSTDDMIIRNELTFTTGTKLNVNNSPYYESETILPKADIAVNYTIPILNQTTKSGSEMPHQVRSESYAPIPEQEPHELFIVATSTEIGITNDLSYSYRDIYTNPTSTDAASSLNNRSEYFEGEYEIPKVITAELSNETIISEVKGIEAIPNSDFINIYADSTSQDQTLNESVISTAEWDKSKGNVSYDSLQKEGINAKDVTNTSDTTFEINGKLYLKYGLEFIPASFVQKVDGHVDVALDLLSLCESNQKDKSKLMQAICKCIEL